MKELLMEDLIIHLNDELGKSFPGEVFLREELEGVYQALINCVWRSARKLHKQQPGDRLKSLDVSKNFSTVQMKYSEIVNQVQNTSGLGSRMSSRALKVLEKRIGEELKESRSVTVEHIGRFEKLMGGTHYRIELDKNLQVARPRGYGESSRPARTSASSSASSAAR